jgi:hypothetical protein
MKYYKLLLVILLFIIILSLLYNHIYKVNEKFDASDTIIKHIILDASGSNVKSSSPVLPLVNCDGSVCLSNLTFNSEYPTN